MLKYSKHKMNDIIVFFYSIFKYNMNILRYKVNKSFQKQSGCHHKLRIHLYLKYLQLIQKMIPVRTCSLWTRLVTLDLSNLELVCFFLELGWICFRSDSVVTEGWDDGNITSGDDQSTCSYLNTN